MRTVTAETGEDDAIDSMGNKSTARLVQHAMKAGRHRGDKLGGERYIKRPHCRETVTTEPSTTTQTTHFTNSNVPNPKDSSNKTPP
jgi:hypothetical protein